jgi:hypothetical protein
MKIPASWESARERASLATDRRAIIAGGCLRDLEHGKPAKDIDIFMSAQTLDEVAELTHKLRKELGGLVKFTPWAAGYRKWTPFVLGVVDFNVDGLQLQIVFLNLRPFNRASVAMVCDWGLCQISFDGANLYRSAPYRKGHGRQDVHALHCH